MTAVAWIPNPDKNSMRKENNRPILNAHIDLKLPNCLATVMGNGIDVHTPLFLLFVFM